MHRSSVAFVRNSAGSRVDHVVMETGTLRIGEINESVRTTSVPPTTVATGRWKNVHTEAFIVAPLEILDPTETDTTETTTTGTSEGIVEEVNSSFSSPSSQLLIENMIHRLREVSCDEDTWPLRHPATATKRSGTRMTFEEMTLSLRRVNHSVNVLTDIVSPDIWGAVDQRDQHCSYSTRLRGAVVPPTQQNAACDELVMNESPKRRYKNDLSLDAAIAAGITFADHAAQMPLSELMDRLQRVNKEITTEPKLHLTLQRKAKMDISNSDDDLARILHQVNNYGVNADIVDVAKTATLVSDRTRYKSPALALSHQSISCNVSSASSSSWIEEECGTATSVDFLALDVHSSKSSNFVDLCCYQQDHDDDGSGCTLHASVRSCDSSVTWYEGSDIDEIVIEDNDVSVSIECESSEGNCISDTSLFSTYS
jgi:hypothetical protein